MPLYQLTLRNIRVFARDKMGFFFALLNPLIVIALYFIFIRSLNIVSIENTLNEMNVAYSNGALGFFLDTWMIAGVVIVVSVTLPLGVFAVAVEDRSKNIFKDFTASPVKSWVVSLSYVLAVFIISVIVCLAVLLVSIIIIGISTGYWLSFVTLITAAGFSLVSCLMSSFMLVYPVSLVKSMGAFSGINAIVGVIISFLCGAYMPLSLFGEGMQTFSAFIPWTHLTAILRTVFMGETLPALIGEAPAAAFAEFKSAFGGSLNFFGHEIPFWVMVTGIFASLASFIFITMFMIKKHKN